MVLSARFTSQPQRWATVPAAAMALTGAGLIILAPEAGLLTALAWIWPPLLLALVVWMVMRVRRQPTGGLQRWLLYPVFAVLALAAIGGGYETLRAATDPAVSQAGSRLVDIGDGRRLSIRCTGSGSPTVVLEPGLGEPASAMTRWIAPDVARTTTVCVYDRAGHGASDAAPAGGADPARDLHALLERAHVPGPYVLAGHSLGGILALDYARRYSSEVGGIVLLDSMHPQQTNAFAGADPLLAIVPTLARTGLARFFFDPSGRRSDGPGHATRPRHRGDAGRPQPRRQADDPRRPPAGRRHRRHRLQGRLGGTTGRPRAAVEHRGPSHRPRLHTRLTRRGRRPTPPSPAARSETS